MDKKQLNYVRGECKTGFPADIYIYDDIESWSTEKFLDELNWLIDYIKPSIIRVHINSAGGSAIDGVGIFTRILDSPIPIHTYNDGLAGSIASCIWAAGSELYMKDYALLFIHNPFIEGTSNADEQENQIIRAFTTQLSTIYKKRFGFDDETIKAIMDGKENEDGTFFTADEAVQKGFLPQANVVVTDENLKMSVAATLKGAKGLSEIVKVFNFVKAPEKQNPEIKTITNKSIEISKSIEMEKQEVTVSVYAALLGLTGNKATEENVQAGIKELKAKADGFDSMKAELDKVKANLQEASTKLAGAEAAKNNLQKDLDKVNAALKDYRKKEEDEKNASILALVEEAINSCKINKEAKDSWIEMAKANFDLTKATLDSIPARKQISKEIANEQTEEVKDGLKTTEEEMKEMVAKVVGENFQFRHL